MKKMSNSEYPPENRACFPRISLMRCEIRAAGIFLWKFSGTVSAKLRGDAAKDTRSRESTVLPVFQGARGTYRYDEGFGSPLLETAGAPLPEQDALNK